MFKNTDTRGLSFIIEDSKISIVERNLQRKIFIIIHYQKVTGNECIMNDKVNRIESFQI